MKQKNFKLSEFGKIARKTTQLMTGKQIAQVTRSQSLLKGGRGGRGLGGRGSNSLKKTKRLGQKAKGADNNQFITYKVLQQCNAIKTKTRKSKTLFKGCGHLSSAPNFTVRE